MNKIPRHLLKHSDEETEKKQDEDDKLSERQRAHRKSQSRFSRYFGERLSGEQITAAERLLSAIEVCEIAGNATASYDGISISTVSFGPKDGLPERVLYASELMRRSRRAIAESSTSPFDRFDILQRALTEDLTPQATGDMIARQYRLKKNEKDRRELAYELIDQATKPIIFALKELRR